MSETPPDFQALARRYLDLWQDQVAAAAADPALAEAMARGVALMTQSAAAVAQATGLKVKQPEGGTDGEQRSPGGEAGPAGPQRPSSPAAAPADPGLDPAQLARRVALLEERVARLEAELGRGGPQPGAKPRRRRAGGLDKA